MNYLKDRKDVVIERNKLGDQYFMDYYKIGCSFGAYARIDEYGASDESFGQKIECQDFGFDEGEWFLLSCPFMWEMLY